MLRVVKEADIAERIETTTNASLLNEKVGKQLVKYGLDYMRVSIYSAIQEKHAKITGSKISINSLHDKLQMLQDIKRDYDSDTPFISVKMLDAYSDENEVFTRMYSDVADEVYLDKPHNWIIYKDKNFINDLYKNDVSKAKDDLKNSSSARIACTLPFFTLAVRSNGDVSPCCIDWIGGTNIGNIYDGSLKEIWNSDKMFEFRKMQLENRKDENSSCKNCEVYLNDYYTKDNIDGFLVEKLRINIP
jgi:radical SAM protein with 4Fe4S-binding SPASM domain